MLESLAAAISPVSEALTAPGYLQRNGVTHPVMMNARKQVKPARAAQTGNAYDIEFRFHHGSEITPLQNDHVSMNGVDWWIVWRVLPSPLNVYSILECKAPPAEIIVPLITTRVPDGLGGWTHTEAPDSAGAFAASVSAASTRHLLSAATEAEMNRVVIGYWQDQASPVVGNRVIVRGVPYSITSVGTDDANPRWGRAVLAREG